MSYQVRIGLIITSFVITTLLVIAMLVGISFTAQAGGDFYQWETADGQVAAADSPKRVPAKYAPEAELRSWSDVEEGARETFPTTTDDEYRQVLQARLAKLRASEEATTTIEYCGGPSTVTQERRDYTERGNSYNGLFYVVRDGCGVETFASRSNPLPYIEIK